MALAPASTDFVAQIRDAVIGAGLLSDSIVVLDPKTDTVSNYNPTADTGGAYTPTVVLGPRVAYVSEQGVDSKGRTSYRVHFIPGALDAPIKKGYVIRAVSSARNPNLPYLSLEVIAAPGGSIVALQKVECVSSGKRFAPYTVTP